MYSLFYLYLNYVDRVGYEYWFFCGLFWVKIINLYMSFGEIGFL